MMRVENAAYLLSLMANWSALCSVNALTTKAIHRAHCRYLRGAWAFSPTPAAIRPRAWRSLSATTTRKGDEATEADATFWNARRNCWRPDVRDVERISFGMPAKKKGTGSRGVPHRLNEDERRSFDQARRQGFLQVAGSSWRSQRRDAPLLNSYRSLMDARGRPMVVLHKLSPNSSGGDDGDRLVVDLSPLRLPDEFEKVGRELEKRISAEFDVQSLTLESAQGDTVDRDDYDAEILDSNNGGSDWETRPIYQLSPHLTSWKVSRSQGKQIGKFLGVMFDNVEANATRSKKPRGVKPGKGRRHGGYGIG